MGKPGLLTVAVALVIMSAVPSSSPAGSILLGQAANYAVLGLTDSTGHGTSIDLSAVTVTGNVAVGQHGSISNMAPSTIKGNVQEYAAGQYSGPGHLNGSVSVNAAAVTQAIADAFSANAAAHALTATQTFLGNLTSAHTFTGNGGLNVIDINGSINLNNANLTLSGGSHDTFVVNVTGNLTLVGTASLALSGVTAGQVLYNFTGGTFAHQGSFDTHVGDVVNGTMLAPFYDMNLDGTWNGELIGGPTKITLLSGAKVNFDPFQSLSSVPEPATIVLALTGLLSLGIVRVYRRGRRRSR